jgi:hypothetical protein
VTVRATARPTQSAGSVPVALIALILIPAVAGSLRLAEVSGMPQILPANPGLTAPPMPAVVVVVVVGAILHAVLGASAGAFTVGSGGAIFGVDERTIALMQGAGRGIDLAVAEYVIRRRRRTHRATAVGP